MSHTVQLSIPEAWDKLTASQLEYVGKLTLMKLPETEFITRCFLRFSVVKIISKNPVESDGQQCYTFSTKQDGKFLISVDVFTNMLTKLIWLISDITPFRNPVQFGKYIGCHWLIYGLTLEEYLVCDQFYIEYVRTNNIRFVDKMMAILYRELFESFNEGADIEEHSKRFQSIKAEQKQVIVLWYTALKRWIKSKYPYLFSDDSTGSTQSPVDYVMALQSALNEGDITHNAQIRKTDVHEAFFELNRKIEQSKSI